MKLYIRDGKTYEAYRLAGSAGDTMAVCNWIAKHGLPWLTGDYTQPESLVNDKGEKNSPGIYIEPQWGSLVLRTKGKETLRADFGDWIVLDILEHDFTVVKDPIFLEFYKPDTSN